MGLPAQRFVEMSTGNQTTTDVKLSRGQTTNKKEDRYGYRFSNCQALQFGASCTVGKGAAGEKLQEETNRNQKR